jgi:hypothetical protein
MKKHRQQQNLKLGLEHIKSPEQNKFIIKRRKMNEPKDMVSDNSSELLAFDSARSG